MPLQNGRKHTPTYVKCSVFPPTHLYLEYRGGQARAHPTSHPRIILRQRHRIPSARPPTTIARRRRNQTANSLSAQSRTHPFRPRARPRPMPPLPRWPMLVQRRLTSPSYPWKASCHQRCPRRRKWRVCFSSCASARWSRSILEIRFSFVFPCFPSRCVESLKYGTCACLARAPVGVTLAPFPLEEFLIVIFRVLSRYTWCPGFTIEITL